MNLEDKSKITAVLTYFIVGFFIYLFDENIQKSKLVKFHIKQALNVFVISLVLSILQTLLSPVFSIFSLIPVLGDIMVTSIISIFALLNVGLFILWIFGIVYASRKKLKNIPIIGKFAKKYLTF